MSTQPTDELIFITRERLTTFLRYPDTDPVSHEAAALAEGQALGWLADAIEAPDDFDWSAHKQNLTLRAWVLELAGISYENPTTMESDGAGDVTSAWRDRRSQILATAREWARRRGIVPDDSPQAAVPVSSGCFPPAPTGGWPDRATRW